METDEKSYIKTLRYLFEKGDKSEIKKYILSFSKSDEEYDIFLEKMQEIVKDDEYSVIEDMIYDEYVTNESTYYQNSPENFDENEYEESLYNGEIYPNLLDNIPEDEIWIEDDTAATDDLLENIGESPDNLLKEIEDKKDEL